MEMHEILMNVHRPWFCHLCGQSFVRALTFSVSNYSSALCANIWFSSECLAIAVRLDIRLCPSHCLQTINWRTRSQGVEFDEGTSEL